MKAEVHITCNMDYGNSITHVQLQVENLPYCREMKGKRCALDANEENAIKMECNSYTSCKHINRKMRACNRRKPMKFMIQFDYSGLYCLRLLPMPCLGFCFVGSQILY